MHIRTNASLHAKSLLTTLGLILAAAVVAGVTMASASAALSTATVVPGPVEAEDYVDAVDTTPGNQGAAGQYVGDADVWPTFGEAGFTVGAVRPDESTTYRVATQSPGEYRIAIRAASGSTGGTVEVRVDGTAIAAPTALGTTGGWWAFESTDLGTASLSSGVHVIEVLWSAGQSNFDRIDVTRVDGPFACDVTGGVLRWPDAAAERYWVYRSTDGVTFTWLGRTLDGTSFIDPNPVVGATYQVHYAGIPRTDCDVIKEPVLPGNSFTCEADPATGVIVWTDAGQTRYWVYGSTDGVTFTWIGRTNGATAFVDTDATAGSSYQVHYAGIPRSNCTTSNDGLKLAPTATVPTSTPTPTPTPTSTPTPTPTPATPIPDLNCGAAAQQAESGEPSGRFQILNDAQAEGGQFAGVPATAPDESALNADHSIEFCVDVAYAATYFIDARVLTPDDQSNSFWVGIDDQPPVRWDIEAPRDVWVDDVVSAGVGIDPEGFDAAGFDLSPGPHNIRFYQADAGVKLDSFRLRPLAVDQSAPCAGLAQEAEDGALSGAFRVTGSAIRAVATPFDSTGSIAEYCVSIPETGLYTLDARTRAEDDASNGLEVQIDAVTDVTWNAPTAATWTTHRVIRDEARPVEVPVEDFTVALDEGNHIVRFIALEPNVGLSSFAFAPTTRSTTITGAPGFPDNPPPLRTVRIEPGDPITNLISSSGERTEFVFAAGTHVIDNDTGIQPLNGQSFVGEVAPDGTLLSVLDGEDRITRAFLNPAEAKNVTIKSLEIKNFDNFKFDGAVDFDKTITSASAPDYATRLWVDPVWWVLEDLWVHHNAGDGVEVGSGGRLVNVRSTDNQWLGVGGHGRNIEIIGGELARNAIAAEAEYDCGFHSGGTKLTRVKELTIRGVHAHNNCGPGIWMDISVSDAVIEDNYLNGNNKAALYYEISFNGLIRNNTVLGSVLIRESWDVIVENNFVRGALRIQDDGGARQGEIFRQPPLMRDGRPYLSRYVTFANNTVCNAGFTLTGIQTEGGPFNGSFDSTLWLSNDYHGGQFRFDGLGPMSYAEWTALGRDVNGTYSDYSECPPVPPLP